MNSQTFLTTYIKKYMKMFNTYAICTKIIVISIFKYLFSSIYFAGILASLLSSGSCATSLRSQSSTTPLPGRRERLPYTPVRNSTRQERLPYTPVKATTKRPSPR